MLIFESPAVLFGALSAMIPLIIHLWPKLKPDEMEFSSLKLLRNLVKLRRKIQFINLIRLILRLLFLIMLCLFFAGIQKQLEIRQPPAADLIQVITTVPGAPVAGFPMEQKISLLPAHNGILIRSDMEDIEVKEEFVPPGKSVFIHAVTFERPGSYRQKIRITGSAEVQERTAVISVMEKKEILLISKTDPDTEIFVSLLSAGGNGFCNVIRGEPDFLTRLDPENFDLIIIADCGILEMKHYRILEKFCSVGGCIWLFPGNESEIDYLNRLFHGINEDNHGLLAGELLEKAQNTKFRVHFPWVLKNDSRINELRADCFFRNRPDEKSKTLVETEDGESLICEKISGKGKALTFFVPFGKDGFTFWGGPEFLSFAADLVFKDEKGVVLSERIIEDTPLKFEKPYQKVILFMIIFCLITEVLFCLKSGNIYKN